MQPDSWSRSRVRRSIRRSSSPTESSKECLTSTILEVLAKGLRNAKERLMPKDTHILQVTVFTPRGGQLDEFVRRQLEGLPKFGDIPGGRGSLFYRSLDN